jgi:hypothetical protein
MLIDMSNEVSGVSGKFYYWGVEYDENLMFIFE